MKKEAIGIVRSFNRNYTSFMGLVDHYILASQYTLPEARVLFELATRNNTTANSLVMSIGIDKGYLSRILLKLEKQGLITRIPMNSDRRSMQISLTPSGRKEFALLDRASEKQIGAILQSLTPSDRSELIRCMAVIENILMKTTTL